MSNEMVTTSSMKDGEVDLPLVIEKLTFMKTIHETVEFLNVLNKKELVEKLFSNNLEKTFFNQLYEKVSPLFSISDRIHNEQLIQEFQTFVSFLEFFEHSIEISHRFADTSDRKLLDLIEIAFKLIESSFLLYRDLGVGIPLTEPFKPSLDSVFEKTVSLTKISVSELDHIVKVDSKSAEDRIETIINVCLTLGRICLLFESITSKPAVGIWKCYTSVLLKYSDRNIGDRVNIVDTCEEICRKITPTLENIKETQTTEANSVRSLQLCRFFCKILKAICDKFRSRLRDAFPSLLRLILTLAGFPVTKDDGSGLPDSAEAAEVNLQIDSVVEQLAVQLLREKGFSSLVKDVDHSDELDGDGSRIPICLLLLLVLENLTALDHESLDVLMDYGKEKSILDTFFKVFSNCFVSLSLPIYIKGVSFPGKPPRFVSFYEYVCTKLCSAVTLFPSRYFQKLELVLLQNLVSKKGMWQKLLAVDVWSYLGRLESSESCYGHSVTIARIVDSVDLVPNSDSCCIGLLLRRLYGFLPIERKLVFVNKFPVDRHRTLWSYLLDTNIDDEIWNAIGGRQQILRENVDGLEKCLTETSSSGPITTLRNMYYHLTFVTKLCSDDVKLSTSSKSRAKDVVLSIFKVVLPSEIDSPIVESVVSQSISVLGHLVPMFGNSELTEILPKLSNLYRTGSHTIRFGVLRFVTCLKRKRIENGDTLRYLSELVKMSLKEETNPIVLHHALDSFSQFSHQTPNVEVFNDCFSSEPFIKHLVIHFLNKVPTPPQSIVVSTRRYEDDLVESCLKEGNENVTGSELETETAANKDEREKEEEEELMYLRNTIEELNERVDKLVKVLEVKEKSPIPDWLGSEIERIVTKLNRAKNQSNLVQ